MVSVGSAACIGWLSALEANRPNLVCPPGCSFKRMPSGAFNALACVLETALLEAALEMAFKLGLELLGATEAGVLTKSALDRALVQAFNR